eukprot:g5501.t1
MHPLAAWPQAHVSLEEDWARGHVYTAHLRMHRPSLQPAGGAGQLPQCRSARKDPAKGCTKLVAVHHAFTPGMFIVMCPHGKVLGITLMRAFESPKTPFEIFSHRLGSTGALIVYDNACHMAMYGAKRFPELWCHVEARIDKFHADNHTLCSAAHDSNTCPSVAAKCSNTEVCEQLNSFLQKHHSTLTALAGENAMWKAWALAVLWNLDRCGTGNGLLGGRLSRVVPFFG